MKLLFWIYYILTYPLTLLCLALIFLYKKTLSHVVGKGCRFTPTCSSYGMDSICQFGAIVGGVLTLNRLIRCRPSNPAGIDYPKLNLLRNYKWKC